MKDILTMSINAQLDTNKISLEAKCRMNTVCDLVRLAVSIFNQSELYYGHGTNNAYDEAVYIVLNTLHLPIHQLEPYSNAKLLQHEIDSTIDAIMLRATTKIPTAYITQEAFLQGYSFYVDERVIIPRSFIAELIVSNSLEPWIEHPELVHSVLDLCTGNGSLAVIAAEHFYDSRVIASDINADALSVAQINVERHHLSEQIELVESDLFTNLDPVKFDLIITNPPYVDEKRMAILPQEYLYEPELALAGGDDGLDLVHKIITQSQAHLSEHGILVLEMGDNRQELEEYYFGLNFTWMETESGDGFIFVLRKKDLDAYFGQL